jgi:hypothetical protein
MAKKSSDEVVNEEADYQARFEKLENDSAETKGLVERLAKKLLGEEAAPKPKPKPDGNPPANKPTGIKAVLPFLFSNSEE